MVLGENGPWPPSEEEPPLAVGSVYGVRDWNWHSGGLWPVSWGASAWRDGENTAVCWHGRHQLHGGCLVHPACVGLKESCGFYAYRYPGFRVRGAVTGVIEGYGTTVVGSRGFRCQKAKVKAVCVPRVNLLAKVPDARRNTVALGLASLLAVWVVMVFLLGGVRDHVPGIVYALQPFASVVVGLSFGKALGRLFRLNRSDPVDEEQLRRAYPSAVIFHSKLVMYARYGLLRGVTLPVSGSKNGFTGRSARYEP